MRSEGEFSWSGDLILVLVGMHNIGFERLVHAADELAAGIPELVVIQKGSSVYHPVHAVCIDFTSAKILEKLTKAARLVVTHAAAGSVLMVLRLGKPLVIVPRSKQNQEAFDDHQQQLARAVAEKYQLPVIHDISAAGLFAGILQAERVQVGIPGNSTLVESLKEQLDRWGWEKR